MACSTLPGGGVLYSTWRGGGGGGGGGGRSGGANWLRIRTLRPSCCCCRRLLVQAVTAPEDCNEEECAPEKEVGKVSMEWKATENTQVLGTFPPVNKKKWTGYVEKDTAGQTNIYAVEPTVYVSDNVISSNTAGDSTEGSEQTLIVAVGLALGLLLGAGLVLRSVSTTTVTSSGAAAPPTAASGDAAAAANLSYYIQKFSRPLVMSSTTPESSPSADQSPSQLAPSAGDVQDREQPVQVQAPPVGSSEAAA